MDDELEKKQTFLRTNILEKGYDAEEFMNFLQSKKGEMGLDLNNWNLDELDIAVKEFISSLDNHFKLDLAAFCLVIIFGSPSWTY